MRLNIMTGIIAVVVTSAMVSAADFRNEAPARVCAYLVKDGLETGEYKVLMDEEYFACSPYKELGKGRPRNNLAYYLSGSKAAVKTIQLTLNVNNKAEAKAAQAELAKVAATLSLKATGAVLPKEVRSAIASGLSGEWKSGKSAFKIERTDFKGTVDGYSISLTLE